MLCQSIQLDTQARPSSSASSPRRCPAPNSLAINSPVAEFDKGAAGGYQDSTETELGAPRASKISVSDLWDSTDAQNLGCRITGTGLHHAMLLHPDLAQLTDPGPLTPSCRRTTARNRPPYLKSGLAA
jgi:hypothetical protein